MAYQVRYTDTTKTPIIVEDNTIDETTGLNFPGRNVTGYGQIIAENFLHLLENFASITAPLKPTLGQLWYDNNASIKQLKVYDGTNWVSAGGLKKGSAQPDVNQSLQGDLWVNTDTQQLYLYTGATWILIGPRFSEGSRTGSEVESLEDTLGNSQIVIVNYVSGERVAIFSRTDFVPKIVLSGFAKIYKGTTLNSNFDGFYGTAEKSRQLVVGTTIVPAENFLRSDVITNNFKGINIKSNTGLQIGEDGQLQLGVDGNVGVIYQKTSGSSLDIRVNNQGTLKSVLRVDSNERVGINNPAPAESLDVYGNVVISRKPNDNSQTGVVRITSNENSTSTTTGSLIVTGGIGVSGNIYVAGEINNSGTLRASNILPIPNQLTGSTVGGVSSPFSTIYANTIRGTQFEGLSGTPATFVGQLQGAVNGSATYLNSATRFSIVGDIVSNIVEFDGRTGSDAISTTNCSANGQIATITFNVQPIIPFRAGEEIIIEGVLPSVYNGTFTVIVGTTSSITVANTAAGPADVFISAGQVKPAGIVGNQKKFITQLASDFVNTKPVLDGVTDKLAVADEFLVSRIVVGQNNNPESVELRKITTNVLLSNIPRIPIGSIMPYAGLEPPPGWLLCDGAEVSKAKYEKLFEAIGYLYGDPQPVATNFELTSVLVTGTSGQFSCAAATLAVGDQILISGVNIGTGSITGYTNPKTYKISATNGSTTFTLVNLNGSSIITGLGTPPNNSGTLVGLRFTIPTLRVRGFNSFRIPDLRGRFALGADNMRNAKFYNSSEDKVFTTSGTEVIHPDRAGRVLEDNASINYDDDTVIRVGSGKENYNLTTNNLPQHEHNLQGTAGAQYGVYSDQQLTDPSGISVKGLGGADNGGRLLQRSGTIRNYGTQQAVNLMNPFLAINYIIYTGLDVSI